MIHFTRKWLEYLVCPVDHGTLHYSRRKNGEFLVNRRLKIDYPIVDGVPVLLPPGDAGQQP